MPPALTGKERWDRYLRNSYASAPIYLASLGSALGGQAANSPKEWKRTGLGYAERAASNYGTFLIQDSIYESGSAILGNEPRYVRCQCRGGWHRAGYALEMTFFTYNRNHKLVFDAPQLAAAYGSGMISTLWYPSHYSATVQGVQTGHQQMGFVAVVRLVQEFSPELKHFFTRKPLKAGAPWVD